MQRHFSRRILKINNKLLIKNKIMYLGLVHSIKKEIFRNTFSELVIILEKTYNLNKQKISIIKI
jgi:hypothetical protein